METKAILVTGATGKQGAALINALLDSPFQILALTRNASSPAAKHLGLLSERVTIVEGDLDDVSSLRRIFEDVANTGNGVWGVFSVLAFPGLGENAAGSMKQGQAIADLALEFRVSCFVYSSADRGGEVYDDDQSDQVGSKVTDRSAKIKIEQHIRELGTKGLRWTILRPGIFMENFEGTIGALTVGVFKAGLKPDTTIQFIAVEDIGRVASAVFKMPEEYASKVLLAVGDILTMDQALDAYKIATGRPIPSIPNFLTRILIRINGPIQTMLRDLEAIHRSRIDPRNGDSKMQMDTARKAYPDMSTFSTWAGKQKEKSTTESTGKGWNNVSIGRLLMGK